MEILLVDRIVTTVWRLRRLLAIETNLYEVYGDDSYSRTAVSLGNILIRDHGDRFTRLYRYESAMERSLYKALHELQRLQAGRAGQLIPPPAAIDVDVDISTSSDMDQT
jgi:hypothetical protein